MKKVFSKEKYIKIYGEEEYKKHVRICEKNNWIDQCDKLTKEECDKLGFGISDNWCVEVEDEN